MKSTLKECVLIYLYTIYISKSGKCFSSGNHMEHNPFSVLTLLRFFFHFNLFCLRDFNLDTWVSVTLTLFFAHQLSPFKYNRHHCSHLPSSWGKLYGIFTSQLHVKLKHVEDALIIYWGGIPNQYLDFWEFLHGFTIHTIYSQVHVFLHHLQFPHLFRVNRIC